MDRYRLGAGQNRRAKTEPTVALTTFFAAVLFIALVIIEPARAADQELLDKARNAVSLAGVQCDLADARQVPVANESSAPTSHGGHRGGGMGGGGRGGGSHYDSDGDASSGRPSATGLTIYEVACRDEFGFVLLVAPHPAGDGAPAATSNAQTATAATSSGPSAEPYNCLELEESQDKMAKWLHCQLDANKDQIPGLKALIKGANLPCDISDQRSMGHTTQNEFFEIACRNGEGFVLSTKRALRYDGGVRAVSCYALPLDAPLSCSLAGVPDTLQALREFVIQQTQGCLPVAQRLVGISPAGNMVFEVGCQSGVAYMVRRAQGESFDTLTACSDKAISSSCKLTNVAQR
jgi:hypothetical protein